MDIWLNLCCGAYANPEGCTALLRLGGVGVINVDSSDIYGGGVEACINANSVFSLLQNLLTAHRVIGIFEQQPCGSGSVARLRQTGAEGEPMCARDQAEPNGKSDLPKTYQKEIHDSELLSFRLTWMCAEVLRQGGMFISEVPSCRGDRSNVASFDPAFAAHANVKSGKYWKELADSTGSFKVTSAMCALRDGYPQKLTDWLISPNLSGLARRLGELQCVHPPGAHVNSFAGEQHGQMNIRKSQVWMPEICNMIADELLKVTPKGGPSLDLGVDDTPLFVQESLQWRDASYIASLRADLSMHVPKSVSAATMAILHDVTDTPIGRECDDHDIDPRLSRSDIFYLSADASGAVALSPVQFDVAFERDNFCLITTQEASKWIVPQSERELKACPQQLVWLGADQEEVDILWGLGCFEEIIDPKGRFWRTKFVRTVKDDSLLKKVKARSRLVCIGPGQQEGREYRRKEVPTPSWSTILLLIAECTVAQGIDFQFDISQYFQKTDCSTPDGDLLLMPPPRYQKVVDGKKVLWRALKWLQGAKGAGYEARREFALHMTTNGVLDFLISDWDPSLFHWTSVDGMQRIRFALHGDDGCGGWASHQTLIDTLVAILEKKYGKLKHGKWGVILGFEVTRESP